MFMPKAKLFALALALAAPIVWSPLAEARPQTAEAQQVPLIEPAQVRALMAMGAKVTIVDVRTPDEFAQGHIDSAISMPLDNLPNTLSSLPKKGKLVVYCRSGHRSAAAVRILLDHGLNNAVSMHGGYLAWTQH